MIQAIRNSLASTAPRRRGPSAMRIGVRLVLGLYFLLFLADTFNIDVLFASLKDKIVFVDDSAISDSVFDSGHHHISSFDASINTNHSFKLAGPNSLLSGHGQGIHNAVYEDEDSPGIEDAQTTASFSDYVLLPLPLSDRTENDASPQIDRIVQFQQFLI